MMHLIQTTRRRVLQRTTERFGLSLIEVLIAMTMTLIVLGAMMQAFKFASVEMQKGRAGLEMANRLRAVNTLLNRDLSRLTVDVKPYHNLAESPKGYFELIEGPVKDLNFVIDDTSTPNVNENSLNNLAVGDYDDVWSGTIRSDNSPFRGRLVTTVVAGILANNQIEAQFAEVIWFTTFTDTDGNGVAEPLDGDFVRLHRRELLIAPDNAAALAEVAATYTNVNINRVNGFFQNNDISARAIRLNNLAGLAARYTIRLNSLEDLAVRGNRFCHTNPNLLNPPASDLPQNRPLNIASLANRLSATGDDVMLTGCLGFDLKVFSPDALSLVQFTRAAGRDTITEYADPADAGATLVQQLNINGGAASFPEAFINGGATFFSQPNMRWENLSGAYVDLGMGQGVSHPLLGRPAATASLALPAFTRVNLGDTTTPNPGILGRPAFPFANPNIGGPPPLPFSIPAYTENVYDTGTSWYNRNSFPQGLNGIDDDGDGMVDEAGTDLFADILTPIGNIDLDNNADGALDAFEEKVRPPYNVELRGIQATIRVVERNSGEVRQITVRNSLLQQ